MACACEVAGTDYYANEHCDAPSVTRTGDGGLVNVLRRFYSIFKDPPRAIFFSTKPLRFPVQGLETRFIECDSPQLVFWDR